MERARVWLLGSVLIPAVLAVGFVLVLWLHRVQVRSSIGNTAMILGMTSLLGAVGAMISTVSRLTQIRVDVEAGMVLHIFEALSRVVAGIAGAFFVAVAVRGNIVLGLLNPDKDGSGLALLMAVCIAAGASEGFCSEAGTALDERNVLRWWKRVRRRAQKQGVRLLRLHAARHTFATLALQAGKSVRWVADQLGHADPALTLRVYAHSLASEGGDLAFTDFGTVTGAAESGSERLYPAPTVDGENAELRNLAKSLARPARLELATFRSATGSTQTEIMRNPAILRGER